MLTPIANPRDFIGAAGGARIATASSTPFISTILFILLGFFILFRFFIFLHLVPFIRVRAGAVSLAGYPGATTVVAISVF